MTLAAVGLVLRLVALGSKPMHHDESEHAWFAWRMLEGHGYSYDPVFHGPVQFYLIGLADLLIGVGDYAARLPAAVLGTIAVFLPFFLRRQLGKVAALTALSRALPVAELPLPIALRARRHPHRDDQPRDLGRPDSVLRSPPPVAADRIAHPPRGGVRDEGDDLHHRLPPRSLLPRMVVAEGLRERRRGGRFLDGALSSRSSVLGHGRGLGHVDVPRRLTRRFTTFRRNPGVRGGPFGSIDYWL